MTTATPPELSPIEVILAGPIRPGPAHKAWCEGEILETRAALLDDARVIHDRDTAIEHARRILASHRSGKVWKIAGADEGNKLGPTVDVVWRAFIQEGELREVEIFAGEYGEQRGTALTFEPTKDREEIST
jgi:hypothetical protein